MNARKRYQVAFFALGWLLAAGLLFQMGLGSGFQAVSDRIGEGFHRVAQRFSDAEGSALRGVRRGSRSEYLAPMKQLLSSTDALRHPRKPYS